MNKTFFTSDTHFGHRGIINHCNRKYSSVEEMDEDIIDTWNDIIPNNADVWHLGDFAWDADTLLRVGPRLNGRKRIIWGNHDGKKIRNNAGLAGFILAESGDYKEIKLSGQRITLCHYPLRVWNKSSKGAWMLHGHCHGNLEYLKASKDESDRSFAKTIDVGWDVWHKPLEFCQLVVEMEYYSNLSIDHHIPDETNAD